MSGVTRFLLPTCQCFLVACDAMQRAVNYSSAVKPTILNQLHHECALTYASYADKAPRPATPGLPRASGLLTHCPPRAAVAPLQRQKRPPQLVLGLDLRQSHIRRCHACTTRRRRSNPSRPCGRNTLRATALLLLPRRCSGAAPSAAAACCSGAAGASAGSARAVAQHLCK